jgi:glycerol-3-phosphate dehydrogenase (NAD(P)+)
MNVGIIGTGPWGRALATLTAEAGHQPRFGYRGRAPSGFPGTPNLHALAREVDLLVLAVPPASVREVVRAVRPGPGDKVVLAARGIEPVSGSWLTDVVSEESACLRVGTLGGPTLAAEALARRPGALVAASRFDEVSRLCQAALHSPICRVYTSRDLRGVELSGAMVSVLAVAVGISEALQLGVGGQAVMVTRGLAEAARLVSALGGDDHTPAGLAGIGDLVACASHPDHPNRQAGERLGRDGGRDERVSLEAQALLTLAGRHGVDLPITGAIAAIAGGRLRARLAVDALMRREARAE